MTNELISVPLIRTKIRRPRLPGDLVPRRRLLDWLCAGASRKPTLISAQAGAGKTTLLTQWLEECPRHADHLFVYVHGGAFVLNAGEAGLSETHLARSPGQNAGAGD